MPAIAALVRADRISSAARLLASEYRFDTREGLAALQGFSLTVLRQGLSEPDPYESAYAATTLAAYDDWSGSEVIAHGLGAPNLMILKAVLEGLAEADNPQARSILEAFYRSAEPLGRALALQAIAGMHNQEALAILLDAAGDPTSSDAFWAAAGLGHSGQRSVLPTLYVLMNRASDSMVRVEAARSIILLGDRSTAVIATLTQALHDKDIVKASTAALVLGDAHDPSVVPVLAHIEADERAGDRLQVAAGVALTHYGRGDGLPLLAAALKDERQRGSAMPLLTNLDFKLGRPLVIVAADSSDLQLRMAAIEALGRNGGEAEAELITARIARAKDPMEVAQIAWSLGRIGSPRSIPVLLELIQNPSPAVRDTAADSLVRIASRVLIGLTD